MTNINKEGTPLEHHEEEINFLLLINKTWYDLLQNYSIYNYNRVEKNGDK
jgi:hypothetical protein